METILSIFHLLSSVLFIYLVYRYNRVIKERDEQITDLFEQIILERRTNDINTAWCLTMVKNDAINKEDFETAAKCKSLIDEVEKRIETYNNSNNT